MDLRLDSEPFNVTRMVRAGAALQHEIDNGKQAVLDDMCENWPFFNTRIAMLEMVYAKSGSMALQEYYDQRTVEENLWPLGAKLHQQLSDDIKSVLAISKDEHLMADLPWLLNLSHCVMFILIHLTSYRQSYCNALSYS